MSLIDCIMSGNIGCYRIIDSDFQEDIIGCRDGWLEAIIECYKNRKLNVAFAIYCMRKAYPKIDDDWFRDYAYYSVPKYRRYHKKVQELMERDRKMAAFQ